MSVTVNSILRLQGADSKAQVREILLTLMKPTMLATLKKTGLRMLTLPGVRWHLEEEIILFCKKNGIKYTIIGVERLKHVYKACLKNMPKDKNVKLIYGDFDKYLSENLFFFNVVFGDYMGGFDTANGERSLANLYSMANEAHPCLFFVTFSTLGRGCSKKDKNGVGMSNIGYSQSLKLQISRKLQNHANVQPVLQINYKGEQSLHRMVVLGFAINFGHANDWDSSAFCSPMKDWQSPCHAFKGVKRSFLPFKPVNINLLAEEIKPYSVMVEERNSPDSQKRIGIEINKIIISLLTKGFNNDAISKALKVSRNKVGGVQARYTKTIVNGKKWKAEA